ncbi:DUF2304 domain-containing protein [Agrococcus lahaulensis]|uniref:DUF2304 domain-containing protein n=1 Tax=Agrococcus lahaulensis TaxID=341722 RepID=UPI000550DD5C|nr:DUF2304 domain-containing protein [Agrococcus lahaulensis]
MDTGKIVIQIILIIGLAVPAIILLLPTRGARGLALRRLTMLAALIVGIIAVIFPSLANAVANAVGVGRGADLLLYGLIIVFIGYGLSTSAHLRKVDRQISELTRELAIAEAKPPAPSSTAAEEH